LILIYKLKSEPKAAEEPCSIFLTEWKPTLFSWYPKGYGFKYTLYSLFKLTGIFKNKNYSAYLAYKDTQLIGSLLLVPAYYRWPFMDDDAIQITYVKIYKEFRGKGYGKQMIQKAILQLPAQVKEKGVWYVTDDTNKASKAVADSVGFELVSYGVPSHVLGLPLLKILRSQPL